MTWSIWLQKFYSLSPIDIEMISIPWFPISIRYVEDSSDLYGFIWDIVELVLANKVSFKIKAALFSCTLYTLQKIVTRHPRMLLVEEPKLKKCVIKVVAPYTPNTISVSCDNPYTNMKIRQCNILSQTEE